MDRDVTVRYGWRRISRGDDDAVRVGREGTSTMLLRVTVPRLSSWLGASVVGARGDDIDHHRPFFVGLPDLNRVRVLPLLHDGEDDHYTMDDDEIQNHIGNNSIQQTRVYTALSLALPWNEHDWDGTENIIYVAGGVENSYGKPAFVLSTILDPEADCPVATARGEQAVPYTTHRHLQQQQQQQQQDERRTANQNVWKAHGILMTAAWAIIIPLAVTTSLVRELLSDGSWFYIHRFLNSLAVLCVIAAFVLAFYAIHQEDDQSHFRETDHRAIGVAVVFLIMFQAILGYARPQQQIEAIEAGLMDDDNTKAPSTPPQTTSTTRPEQEQKQQESEDGMISNTIKEHEHMGKLANNKKDNDNDNDDDDGPELTNLRKLWSLQHRLLGFCLIGVCWYNIHRGIVLYEDRFGDILTDRSTTAIFWGGMIGFVIIVFVLVTIVRSFT